VRCIDNGDTCLGSIYNGLKYLEGISSDNDLVLIHDSVRPFIDDALIKQVINEATIHGNCIPVAKQIETPIMVIGNEVKDTINRDIMYSAKAPQCFKYGNIFKAYQTREPDFQQYCDSAQIAFSVGIKLHTVQCEPSNIKITSRMDFYLARALLNCEEDKQFI
jgi:2-C-methyl-D-erythritol 4-phosphate cytidylyltransferase